MNFIYYFKKNFFYILLSLSLITFSFLAHTNFLNYELIIGVEGFSIVDLLTVIESEKNFSSSFDYGVLTTAKSLSYQIINILRYFEFEKVLINYLMILFEIIIIFFSSSHFSETIFKNDLNEKDLATIKSIIFILITLSDFTTASFSNFKQPYYHGQFYGFATALSIFSISFNIRNKFYTSKVLIIISSLFHPIISLPALFFILIRGAISQYKKFTLNKTLNYLIFLAGYLICIYLNFFYTDQNHNQIPSKDWIEANKALNFHWFPFENGTFTNLNKSLANPALNSILMSFLIAFNIDQKFNIKKYFKIILFSCTLLIFFGLIFSLSNNVFLIKLSLIRASDFINVIFVFILLFGVKIFYEKKKYFLTSILLTVVFLSFYNPELISLNLFLIFYVVLYWKKILAKKNILLHSTVLSIIIFLILIFSIFSNSIQIFLITLIYQLTFIFFIFFVLFNLKKIFTLSEKKITIFFTSVLILGINWGYHNGTLSNSLKSYSKSFIDIQLWAKNNSNSKSLFIIDPCINYGWTSFSERQSIGTPRMWALSFMYSGNYEAYERGKKLLKEFNINISDLKKMADNPWERNSIMCKLSRDYFYNYGNITKFMKKNNIDYLVVKNKFLEKDKDLEDNMSKIYSNLNFSVLN